VSHPSWHGGASYILEGIIDRGPRGYRLCVTRNDLELAKARLFPQARLKQDRYDLHLPALEAHQRLLHLCTKTVLGCEKIRANEEQDQVGGIELSIDLSVPVGPWFDLAVVPLADLLLLLERGEIGTEALAQVGVLV
jgi:hypothetical protein